MKLKPDDQVAADIVAELRKGDLLPADKLDDIRSRLADGRLTSEDWKLLAELALDHGRAENDGHST